MCHRKANQLSCMFPVKTILVYYITNMGVRGQAVFFVFLNTHYSHLAHTGTRIGISVDPLNSRVMPPCKHYILLPNVYYAEITPLQVLLNPRMLRHKDTSSHSYEGPRQILSPLRNRSVSDDTGFPNSPFEHIAQNINTLTTNNPLPILLWLLLSLPRHTFQHSG